LEQNENIFLWLKAQFNFAISSKKYEDGCSRPHEIHGVEQKVLLEAFATQNLSKGNL
jgi:hypothetical protein